MDKKNELTLNEIQEIGLNVLKKIKEIFDENNWKYYLAYGTLIGAIRHQGFIPWDDDIDIWVPRQDYEKFINYCIENKEKIKPFELIHYSTNKKYVYPLARFSDSRYTINYGSTKEYGLGIFVDIYPIDGVNHKDKKHLKKLRQLIKKAYMLGNKNYIKSSNAFKNIIKYPYYLVTKKYTSLNKILSKIDKLAKKYDFYKQEWFECTCWSMSQISYKREWLENDEDIEKKFEDEFFRIPSNYDELLKRIYGDYMKLPSEKERIPHHFYKAYKK